MATAAFMTSPINLLFPNEWHSDTLQYRLSRAGIVAPVRADGLQDMYPGLPCNGNVYVPFIGDDSIKLFWEKTGGNPIARIDRNKLCIVVSPVVHGIRYDDIFYGHVRDDGSVSRKPLPPYFEENFDKARATALCTLNELTPQKYEVIATKLNPLTNGRCNIVIFLQFQHECPFDRQFYTPVPWPEHHDPKVRIIPRPYVNKFGEQQPGLKLTFNFVYTDKEMFAAMYNMFQNYVEQNLNMRFRYMKVDDYNKAVHVYAQYEGPIDELGMEKKLAQLEKIVKNTNFAPYVIVGMECSKVMI